MAIRIFLHHDRHFDLLSGDEASERGLESTGQFDVETRDGVQTRERVAVDAPDGFTLIELPDDYEATPQALLHLVQTLTERHSAEDDVVGVSGDNQQIVARLAALLNADVRKKTPVMATETDKPVAAPGSEES